MARYNTLKSHAAADTVKWVIIFLLMVGVIGAVVTLFVMLDRQTTVTEIGAEQYIIGGLDEVDILVSDQLPSPQLSACLAQAGVRVIVPQNK